MFSEFPRQAPTPTEQFVNQVPLADSEISMNKDQAELHKIITTTIITPENPLVVTLNDDSGHPDKVEVVQSTSYFNAQGELEYQDSRDQSYSGKIIYLNFKEKKLIMFQCGHCTDLYYNTEQDRGTITPTIVSLTTTKNGLPIQQYFPTIRVYSAYNNTTAPRNRKPDGTNYYTKNTNKLSDQNDIYFNRPGFEFSYTVSDEALPEFIQMMEEKIQEITKLGTFSHIDRRIGEAILSGYSTPTLSVWTNRASSKNDTLEERARTREVVKVNLMLVGIINGFAIAMLPDHAGGNTQDPYHLLNKFVQGISGSPAEGSIRLPDRLDRFESTSSILFALGQPSDLTLNPEMLERLEKLGIIQLPKPVDQLNESDLETLFDQITAHHSFFASHVPSAAPYRYLKLQAERHLSQINQAKMLQSEFNRTQPASRQASQFGTKSSN